MCYTLLYVSIVFIAVTPLLPVRKLFTIGRLIALRNRIISVFLCVVAVFSVFLCPASAYFAAGISADSGDLVWIDYTETVPSEPSNDWFWTHNVIYRTSISGDDYTESSYSASGAFVSDSNVNAHVAVAFIMDYEDRANAVENPRYYPYVISDDSSVDFVVVGSNPSGPFARSYPINIPLLEFGTDQYFDGLYFARVPHQNQSSTIRESVFSGVTSEFYGSLFDSVSDAVTAFHMGPVSNTGIGSLSLPAGNSAWFHLSGNGLDLTMSGNFWSSGLFGTEIPNTSVTWGNAATFDPLFDMQASGNLGRVRFLTQSQSLLGDSYGVATVGYGFVGVGNRWVYVYNPLNSGHVVAGNPNGDTERNPTITITFDRSQVDQVKAVPLKTKYIKPVDGGLEVFGVGDGSYYNGSYSNGATTWTDATTGDPVTSLPTGGLDNVGLTDDSGDSGFFDWISSIVDSITGIFTWSHNAIVQLIDSGRDFVGTLSSLYSWLPAEVLAVLTSAILLVIAIGVIKVLL